MSHQTNPVARRFRSARLLDNEGRFVDEKKSSKERSIFFCSLLSRDSATEIGHLVFFFWFFFGAYLELGILLFWSRMPQTRKHLGHTSVAFIQGSGTLSPFPPSPNVHILNYNTNGLFVFLTKVQEQSI